MKLPAFQFYPGDWRKDPAVQSLDYTERGIWIELLCLMHESNTPGKLMIGGVPYPEDRLARTLGLIPEVMGKVISTLITLGVAQRCTETGAVMSARMVRDREIHQKRAEVGKLGGNPNLQKGKPNPYYTRDKQKDNQVVNQKDNQKITPSVSSSSSSSESNTLPPATPAVDPRHHEITSQWGGIYKTAVGSDYAFSHKDPKALQRFLKTCKDDSATILGVAARAFDRRKVDQYCNASKQASSIHKFCTAYNDINAELKTSSLDYANNSKSNGRGFSQQNDYSGFKGD